LTKTRTSLRNIAAAMTPMFEPHAKLALAVAAGAKGKDVTHAFTVSQFASELRELSARTTAGFGLTAPPRATAFGKAGVLQQAAALHLAESLKLKSNFEGLQQLEALKLARRNQIGALNFGRLHVLDDVARSHKKLLDGLLEADAHRLLREQAAEIARVQVVAAVGHPGEMAQALDRTTIQTPALDLIDQRLVDVAEGRCERLIISMPPQEGKSEAGLAPVPAVDAAPQPEPADRDRVLRPRPRPPVGPEDPRRPRAPPRARPHPVAVDAAPSTSSSSSATRRRRLRRHRGSLTGGRSTC
jgi:hypothetical protein